MTARILKSMARREKRYALTRRIRPFGSDTAEHTAEKLNKGDNKLLSAKISPMKTGASFVAFTLLLTAAIAQALADGKDVLTTDRDLERRTLPMLEKVVAVYKTSSDPGANNTVGVLVSSTCSNVLLFGTDLFMGAAFVTAMLPVLLQILGFSGTVHNIRCADQDLETRRSYISLT
jgi:hypothetical protein